MRRHITSAVAMLVGITVFAQDYTSFIHEGMSWSENNYVGNARSAAMGNALTAVGGDLGGITINPASGAVATYSSVILTPGVSISMDKAQGESGTQCFGVRGDQTKAMFIFPNGGINFIIDLGNDSGLKRLSLSFVANATNFFNDGISSQGENKRSSYAGYLANGATENCYDQESLSEYKVDYATSAAYNSGVIAHYDDITEYDYYLGVTENIRGDQTVSLAAPINQRYSRQVTGSKMDYIFNVGLDVSDVLFLGASLGIQNLKYRYNDLLTEEAIEPALFQTFFSDFSYSYAYTGNATGVYGKFGFILTPVSGLRVGGAIQTPTGLNMSEAYGNSFDCSVYTTKALTGRKTNYATAPNGSWRYTIESPWRFNVGLAYSIGKRALISADYEMVNYKDMKYKAYWNTDVSTFEKVNNQIKGNGMTTYCMGNSHLFRAGLEIKATDEIAARLGYNLTTCAEMTRPDLKSDFTYIDANQHTISAGLGYDSPGSFFCDLAAQYYLRPANNISVYGQYISDVPATTIRADRTLLNIVASFGWRF